MVEFMLSHLSKNFPLDLYWYVGLWCLQCLHQLGTNASQVLHTLSKFHFFYQLKLAYTYACADDHHK